MSVRTPFQVVDIVYDDRNNLLARLYIPEKPIGAVVDVHGGGWISGDRLSNAVIAEALAEAGILVMSIDFRKPPVARYPAAIIDTHLAIRWLKAIAPIYGVPSERVGGLGTSSGGHQLMLAYLGREGADYSVATLPKGFAAELCSRSQPIFISAQNAELAFLILGWPVADPFERYCMVVANRDQQLVDAHHAFWPDEAAMADANPQALLEAMRPRPLPPMLILQGGKDANLPQGSADRLASAYQGAGGTAKVALFPDAPHAFVTREPNSDAAGNAKKMIVDFAVGQSVDVR